MIPVMKLTIATCQFSSSADVCRNLRNVLRQMNQAKEAGAEVIHFHEQCLSGYAGIDFKTFDGYEWDLLDEAHQQVLAEAKKLKLWTILGSAFRLTGKNKPHNSLYIINSAGSIVDRYDKMFCTGDPTCRSGDLAHYAPGSHLPVFSINGVKCGTQICHDFRYQEMYREYERKGVRLMFHSYHNAAGGEKRWRKATAYVARYARSNHGETIHGIIVPPTMQAYAANNFMWISSTNASTRESAWPSFFVRPDGIITGKLSRNRAGVLISTVDTEATFYDASEHWRRRAMDGVYHSGKLIRDKRTAVRNSF